MERFCCQVRSEPRQPELKRLDFKNVLPLPLGCDCDRSSVVVCNYYGPITAVTIPSENTAFTTCVDPISPQSFSRLIEVIGCSAEMVEAPGTPRVRSAYFTARLSP